MGEKLIFEQESYLINGACMNVYSSLGHGFLESVYQECLEIEFKKKGIPFISQKALTITYDGHTLRHGYKVDFVCFCKIIVEIKAMTKLSNEHKSQVINYLKATGFELGLLYNFGHFPLLERVRIPNLKSSSR